MLERIIKRLVLLFVLIGTLARAQWTMDTAFGVITQPPPGVQPWLGILDPTRAVDWSIAGVQGGIPHYYNICNDPSVPAGGIVPTGVKGWIPNTHYNVGNQIADTNNHIQQVTVAGTSDIQVHTAAGSGILWATSAGQTTQDGTITWTMVSGPTDAYNINLALQNCGALATSQTPLVVLLAPGTFYSSFPIAAPQGTSYLVLRGSGPDQTTIKFFMPIAGGGCNNVNGSFSGTAVYDICIAGTGTPGATKQGAIEWLGTNGSQGVYAKNARVLDLGPPPSGVTINPGLLVDLTQRDDAVGLCPVTPATVPLGANCTGKTGISNDGAGNVTGITSAPYPELVAGAQIMLGHNVNSFPDPSLAGGTCGGYATLPNTTATVVTATTTAQNTTFTYQSSGPFSAVGSACQPSTQYPYQDLYVTVVRPGPYVCPIVRPGCAAGTGTDYLGASRCPETLQHTTTPVPGSACADGEISQSTLPEIHVIDTVCLGAGIGNGPNNALCKTATEVVLDSAIMAPNYRSDHLPIMWWTAPDTTKPYQASAQWDGIEDLTIDTWYANQGMANELGISIGNIKGSGLSFRIQNAVNSWYKNIRSIAASSKHIDINNSAHISFVDSYLWGSAGVGASNYGFNLTLQASSILIQNDIGHNFPSPFQSEQSMGSVRGYNYTVDGRQLGGYGTLTPMMALNHGFTAYELAEGNDVNQCQTNTLHGTSYGTTFFRNRCRSQDTPWRIDVPGTRIIAAQDPAYQRAQNFIGNIMGMPNFQNFYVSRDSGLSWDKSLYILDDSVNAAANYYPPSTASQLQGFIDSNVSQTLMRWGNFDVVSNATRWCGDPFDSTWTTACVGVISATYLNSGTFPANKAGYYCNVTFQAPTSSGLGVARGRLTMPTASSTVPAGTSIAVWTSGVNYSLSSPPTYATLSAGTASPCSGQINLQNATTGSISEVPTTGSGFVNGNPVPANHGLPASFYLSGQPTWWRTQWGTPSFPAIGPDVSALGPLNATCANRFVNPYLCDGIQSMSYVLPAQLCFVNTPVDPAYQKTWTIVSANVANVTPATAPAPINGRRVELTLTGPPLATSGIYVPPANTTNSATYKYGNDGRTTVTVSGVNPPQYNGVYNLYRVDPPTNTVDFYINQDVQPPTNGSGGTMTWPDIRLFNAHTCYPGEL